MTAAEKQSDLKEKILAGLEKAYQKLLEFKKQKGTDLVVMQNGRIVKIWPE